jgi:hypothetical protein
MQVHHILFILWFLVALFLLLNHFKYTNKSRK